MTLPVLIGDFETIGAADLRKVGGRNYAFHESTRLILSAWEIDGQRIDLVEPGRKLNGKGGGQPFGLKAGEFIAVAHNARTFDRFVWSALGWPEPAEWHDTVEFGRRAGSPAVSLDALSKQLLGMHKDHEGSKLVKELNRTYAARYGQPTPQMGFSFAGTEDFLLHPDTIERIRVYCNTDVDELAGVYDILKVWARVDEKAHAVWAKMQDRGITFDRELAEVLLEVDAKLAKDARERAKVLDPSGVRSTAKFIKRMAELGVTLENAQKKTLANVLKSLDPSDPMEAQAIDMIKARQAGTTIAAGKLRAGLARVSPDSVMRDTTNYYAAHTGRGGGKGMQLHNLTKGKDLPEVAAVKKADELARGLPPGKGKIDPALQDQLTEERIRRLIAREPGAADGLHAAQINTLTRATLKARDGNLLVVTDFAGVEARFLAWAANDAPALEVFASGADPYKIFMSRLLGKVLEAITDQERQVGKVSELGLGYQMGWEKFTLWLGLNDVDVAALERDYGLTPRGIVEGWRDLHQSIVQFWYDSQDAAMRAARGERVVVAGRFEWRKKGNNVTCVLPSGRPVIYQRMAKVWWERRGTTMSAQMPDGTWQSYHLKADDERRSGYGLVYLSRRGWQSTHGGKLAENVVQAGCRDLLFEAADLMEESGLNPVLDVHDELANDVPAWMAKDALLLSGRIMSSEHAPTWAEGLPLKSEGFQTFRYRK